jgi:HEAT repeat protein
MTRRVWLSLSLAVALSPCLPACRGDFDEVIDSPMYKNPDLPASRLEMIFPEKAKGLWVKALRRPEADMRCKAAEAVTLACQRGVTGLETFVGPLAEALDQPDQHPAVRLAAAQALVALDARDAAPSLFAHAQSDGREMREVVEPALARWDYRPARAAWLKRLRDPATPQRGLVLTIQGLAAVGEAGAADRLREIALSDRADGPVRLEAARALGALRGDGLEKDAEGLAADASPRGVVGRLVAASMLRRHKSDDAVRVLKRLADDAEPTVAAVAVARLLEIDPDLVVPIADHLLGGPDANLRSFAVEALFRRPTGERIRVLADRLDDADPGVRVKARRSLRELAEKKEFRDRVIEEATRVLAGSAKQWRGLEQAAILLTQLDHKPAAKRLVELLPSERPEVAVTTAWGLRKLAVADTLPPVAAYVRDKLGRILAGQGPPAEDETAATSPSHQLSQLNQFLGEQKYAPADPVLRPFIPHRPDKPIDEARAAAVWALGMIHEGKPDGDLAAALEARLNDVTSIPPEDNRVRRMAAVALGRMQAKESLPSLRRYCPDREPDRDDIHNACGWAIERLGGEAMLPPKTIRAPRRDWFLVPDD